jgi:hypothetical protein
MDYQLNFHRQGMLGKQNPLLEALRFYQHSVYIQFRYQTLHT